MAITCFIRHTIDPWKKEEFKEYALNWGQVAPLCGADPTNYLAPHKGSATTAYEIDKVESLVEYEADPARFAADLVGQTNYAFAEREKFPLSEERILSQLAFAPYAEVPLS